MKSRASDWPAFQRIVIGLSDNEARQKLLLSRE